MSKDEAFPGDWILTPITVEDAERLHPGLENDSRAERIPHIRRPFAFQSPMWEALRARMQPGDELVSFTSPPDSWSHLAGRAGVALMRQGRIVVEIVTMMN